MMVLVKHDTQDYRLHDDDGSVIESWDWPNDWLPTDETERKKMINAVKTSTNTAQWLYRDNTNDDETLPW